MGRRGGSGGRTRGGASAVLRAGLVEGAVDGARGEHEGHLAAVGGRGVGVVAEHARGPRSARGSARGRASLAGACPRARASASRMRAGRDSQAGERRCGPASTCRPRRRAPPPPRRCDGRGGQDGQRARGRRRRARPAMKSDGHEAARRRGPARGSLQEAQGGALHGLRGRPRRRRRRSGRAAPPPPRSRGRRGRTRRPRWPCRGSCATRSARGRPRAAGRAVAACAAGESMTSCSVVMAPSRRSPSSTLMPRRRQRARGRGRWARSRVGGQQARAAGERAPRPGAARSSASSRSVGRW